jgi:23S rRNA pseudouridine1911/1915/1917 synthase
VTSSPQTFHLAAVHDGLSLSQALKQLFPEQSWSQIRTLIGSRRVQLNGNLCLDEGRRVRTGEVLALWDRPLARPADATEIRIVHLDEHLVVVQKPAGMTTLRHRAETDLPERRKQLQPTLDELVPRVLARHLGIRFSDESATRRANNSSRRTRVTHDRRLIVYPVHRLDRDTSGLLVLARTRDAERVLIRMFARHAVERAYVAVVRGHVEAQTIDTWLVRDRGDGLRGSSPVGESAEGAQRAITHVRPLEHLPDYTILECRLETGRTHQIRIHLSELGHPLCGEKTYTHVLGQLPVSDTSQAPRQALHAAALAFTHPMTGQVLRFRMSLPEDLKQWLLRLRNPPRNSGLS